LKEDAVSARYYTVNGKWFIFFTAVVVLFFSNQSIMAENVDENVLKSFQQYYAELEQNITDHQVQLAKKALNDDGKIASEHALIQDSDNDPLDVVLRRTEALLDDLKERNRGFNADPYYKRLDALKKASTKSTKLLKTVGSTANGTSSREELFISASALNREVALANPKVDFDTLLFAGVVKAGGTYHMCDQYLGWNAQNGGGIYLLTGIKSGKTSVVDLLSKSKVEKGAMAGKSLSGGAALSPDLSYDGKTIVFAWTNETDKCYHIFKMNIDGTGLIQLTDGKAANNGLINASHNDFDPCFLPNGRIAFISERRGGYGRCHPRNVPTYTLYSMKDDGSDITCLSYHETNEWHPSVNNEGQIVFTRWDYLDRDDCIAHHLWLCDPDGSNPRAPHGNYPTPLTTMTGTSWKDGRSSRPNGEWNIRAIPGTSKYVATAGGHHAHSFGQLVLIDISIRDDNKMSQVTGITTKQTSWSDADGPYGTAWPLSEGYYLCNYNKQIVLLDNAGNREVLYTASGDARPIDPIPVKPRKTPPTLSEKTWQGERAEAPGHNRATISVMNVYEGDVPVEKTSNIKRLRIVQVIPQFTPLVNQVRVGYASESLCRMSLGTVPVESDGSVYCEAPVGKEFYFQLLDEKGRAVQSMRAGAFVHPGEQLTCLGCHEDKWEAPQIKGIPIALTRAPSKLEPDSGGVEPINFYRLVKPVFDKQCAPCHKSEGKGPDMSYSSLENYAFWWPGPGTPYVNGDIITAKHGGSRTIPGKFGAIASPLNSHLEPSHHNVKLTQAEISRITLWLDCNSNELGAYTKVSDQKSGKLVWPELDCDSKDPTGVESNRPIPNKTDVAKRLSPIIVKQLSLLSACFSNHQRQLVVKNLQNAPYVIVELFDATGRRLFNSQRIEIHDETAVLNMVPLPPGLIIAKLRTDQTIANVKVMKAESFF
jgi:Tol biopolymer transport system component